MMNFKTLRRKITTVINDPKTLFLVPLIKFSYLFTDETYIKLLFGLTMNKKLNLKNPQTFNEKIQWLKLNYRKPELTKMVDKYEAKEYVSKIIGEEFIVKNIGLWDSFDKIDFDKLPDQFVLKTTHDQGGVVIVNDINKLDKNATKKKLTEHLKVKHYYLSREWPYKNVQPRILAEEFLKDDTVGDLYEYKFFCFNGEPRIMYIAHGREKDICYFDWFDMEFNHLDIERRGYPHSNIEIKKPVNWDLMISLSEKLSKDLPLIRVDFYSIKDKVYVGELTFFQGGGLMPFYPEEWDYKLGSWINLPIN